MKQVVYRKEKAGTFAGEVHAIFPEYCDGYFAGYDENGIESSYSLAFLTDCTEDATPEESAKVRAFLENMGYMLESVNLEELMEKAFDLAWAEYASGNGSEKDKSDLFHLRNNFYPTAGAAFIITENACSMEGAILALAGL